MAPRWKKHDGSGDSIITPVAPGAVLRSTLNKTTRKTGGKTVPERVNHMKEKETLLSPLYSKQDSQQCSGNPQRFQFQSSCVSTANEDKAS